MGDRPSFKNTLEGRILYELMFTKRKEKAYMNKQESDILNTLLLEPFINQRILAEESGHSLGVVNRSLKELINPSNSESNHRVQRKDTSKSDYFGCWIRNAYGSYQYGNAERTT